MTLAEWAERHGVHLKFINPGKPTQDSYAERFNRTCRQEIIASYIVQSLDEVRELTRTWIDQHNRECPHKAAGGGAPLDTRGANNQEGARSPEQKAG